MIKKVGIIALAVSILMSGGAFANTTETKVAETKEEWTYSFSDEKDWLKEIGVKATDMTKLEKLFNEAVALEKADKFDDAMKKWEDYYKILESYDTALFATNCTIDFEEEKDWLKEIGVSDADITALEKLYDEIEALEKADKHDDAEKKWEAVEKIMEKYYDKMGEVDVKFDLEAEKEWLKEIGVSASDITALENLYKEIEALEKADKRDDAEKKWEAVEKIMEKYYDKMYELKFEDEKEWLKELKVSATDMTTLEKLFNEAIALTKADKEDEANKKWEDYDKILNKYFDMTTVASTLSIESEKEWFKELGVNDTDMASLEKLINEINALYKADKYDDADEKWEAYDKILTKYYNKSAVLESSFADEKEFLKDLNISSADMTTLEKLYNEAVALYKADKYDDADKKMDAYYTLLEKYHNQHLAKEMTFADEKEWLTELKVNAADMTTLEKIFNEIKAAYTAGNQKLAEEKWEAFDKILDKYYD